MFNTVQLEKRLARQRSGYIPTLDGWRALAILSVIAYHSLYFFGWRRGVVTWLRYGDLGVALFFSISGVLITSRLLQEERKFGSFSLKHFYVRRFWRILPPALTFLLVIALAHLLFGLPLAYKGVGEALCSIRNILNPNFDQPGMRVTEHFWSLSVEEQFYLFLPFGLFLVRGRSNRLMYLGVSALLAGLWAGLGPRLLPGYYVALRGHHTELNLHGILIGSFLAVAISHSGTRDRLHSLLHPGALLGFCLLLAVAAHFLHCEVVLWEQITFPFLVLSTSLHPDGYVGRVLESKALKYIGRLSFSLYLWQQLFMVRWPLSRTSRLGWTLEMPFDYALMFAIAAISFYFIEKPAMRLGHKLAPPPSPGHADVAGTPQVAPLAATEMSVVQQVAPTSIPC